MKTDTAAAIALTLLLLLMPFAPAGAQTLERFASFPADTFAPGPTSGQFIAPANGRTPPFNDKSARAGRVFRAARLEW